MKRVVVVESVWPMGEEAPSEWLLLLPVPSWSSTMCSLCSALASFRFLPDS
jgi:hypothetical protein